MDRFGVSEVPSSCAQTPMKLTWREWVAQMVT